MKILLTRTYCLNNIGGKNCTDSSSHRVGIKPGFYHKAQPGVFYEGGFWGFYGFYVGFINLKFIITPTTSCYLSFSLLTVLV